MRILGFTWFCGAEIVFIGVKQKVIHQKCSQIFQRHLSNALHKYGILDYGKHKKSQVNKI